MSTFVPNIPGIERHQISDLDDPRVAMYRQLPNASTFNAMRFIVEGRLLVQRLIDSDCRVESVLCTDAFAAEIAELLHTRRRARSGNASISLLVTSKSLLQEVVGFSFHRGVLACGWRPKEVDLKAAIASWAAVATVVICPATCDSRNVGSILRNCAAFGVQLVILGREAADPFSRQALRVSMGASLTLPIHRSQNLVADLKTLKNHRFELIASVLSPEAERLAEVVLPERVGLCMGSEADGDDPNWLSLCQRFVTVPMQGRTDSMNVASASAVFLYQFTQIRSRGANPA